MKHLTKTHLALLISSFVLIIIGLVLSFNYFFVKTITATEVVANIALVISFLVVGWYMVAGYKKRSDFVFGIPLFMYAACVIVMIATTFDNLDTVNKSAPFILASMGTMIVYPIVIAFNQRRVKLCLILFGIMICAEVLHGIFYFLLYRNAGVIEGGSLTETLRNIHVFVRSFLTSILALCYTAKIAKEKYDRTHNK